MPKKNEHFSLKEWTDCCGKFCSECKIMAFYKKKYGKKKGKKKLRKNRGQFIEKAARDGVKT